MIAITAKSIDNVCGEISRLVRFELLANCLGVSDECAEAEFKIALTEARQTLALLENFELPEKCCVLEVGAGMGIASTALSFLGFQVTSLEPGGVGFEVNKSASKHISLTVGTSFTLLAETAEEVRFSDETKFDLIISNNVLEHVQNVEKSLTNLLGYLSPSGAMIHSCPNYTFPFEPHFGSPLVPLKPRITSFFLSSAKRQSGLWKSLNFVTAFQVRRIVSQSSFSVQFRRGTMLKSFNRLKTDSEFAKRHRVLAKTVISPVVFSILSRLVSLPYWIATPMDFIVVGNQYSRDQRVLNWLSK